jgi:hypothetical protein
LLIKPFYNFWDYGWIWGPTVKEGRLEWAMGQLEEAYDLADRGVYLIDPQLGKLAIELSERCREMGSECVLGFKENLKKPDRNRFAHAAQLTDTIALANTSLNEWAAGVHTGFDDERRAMDLCGEFGVEWRCPLIHNYIIHDLTRMKLRDWLVEHDIKICSLCAYLVCQWCSSEKVQKWIEPLNDPWTGAGKDVGLMAGTARRAKKAGFSTMVCTPPIPLEFPT